MLKLRKFNLHKDPYDASEKCHLSHAEKAERKAARREGRRRIFKKYVLPILSLVLLIVFLFGVLVTVVSASMVAVGQKRVIDAAEAVTLHNECPFDCILVLGAGLRPDGSPSDMLHDRVITGVELYRALDLPLLMSGDQTGDYNEVAAMKTLAMSLGVPEDKILLDPQGYSTYESVIRAKENFGVHHMIIVTQEYHLHRALYLSGSQGIDAYGVSADLRTYWGQSKREVREILARFKDLFQGAKKN